MSPINFQELPKEGGSEVVKPGYYLAQITKAEMRNPNSGGKAYLSLTYDLINGSGQKVGSIRDGQFDSQTNALRYKLRRFMEAHGLQTMVTFELADLAKLVLNRSMVIDIENAPDSRDKGKPLAEQRMQAQPKIFGSEIYWPAGEFQKLLQEIGQTPEKVMDPEDFPFDAADGEVPAAPAKNQY